jgi:hypothetical protein
VPIFAGLKFGLMSAAFPTANLTDELVLDVGQPHVIGPAVGVGLGVMAAADVAAVDQSSRVVRQVSASATTDPW